MHASQASSNAWRAGRHLGWCGDGKHSLSALIRRVEVQQDRGHAVAPVGGALVVEEVIEVRLILLPQLILEHLRITSVSDKSALRDKSGTTTGKSCQPNEHAV